MVRSDVTIVVPWQQSTGSKHDYLFCYCPLVGILFEILRIENSPVEQLFLSVKFVNLLNTKDNGIIREVMDFLYKAYTFKAGILCGKQRAKSYLPGYKDN